MAIVVGCGLGALVLAAVSVRRIALVVVIAVAAGIGVVEMVRALRATGIRPPLIPLLAGAVIMPALAWSNGLVGLILAVLMTVGAAVVWRLCRRTATYRRDLAIAAMIAVYVPLLLSFGVLLVHPADGRVRVLVTLLAVVLSDTGGYAVGAASPAPC
jgi:phosphatidate cytidylyltransferase